MGTTITPLTFLPQNHHCYHWTLKPLQVTQDLGLLTCAWSLSPTESSNLETQNWVMNVGSVLSFQFFTSKL